MLFLDVLKNNVLLGISFKQWYSLFKRQNGIKMYKGTDNFIQNKNV